MDHLILNPNSDKALIAQTAIKALKTAQYAQTHNSGSVFVADGKKNDDGTDAGSGTIINGNNNGGIQQWVNDHTPPGKPTGLSISSKLATISVAWDGTLEGGVPDDFDHIEVLGKDDKGNNLNFGIMKSAGQCFKAELTPGAKVTVWAFAYDDAHDSDGKSTPNKSEQSAVLTATVESAVDPGTVEKAQSDAQNALNQLALKADSAMSKKLNDTVTGNKTYYAVSTSATTAPTTGWSTTQPAWKDGSFIWMKTTITKADGTTEDTAPVVLTGPSGKPGDPGKAGDAGKPGVGVKAITRYFQSAAAAPAKPTVATPPSPWTKTEPDYVSGKNLYYTDEVLYDNGQFSYSVVQKSSSYTASASAINTANSKSTIFLSSTTPTAKNENDWWFKQAAAASADGIIKKGDVIGIYKSTAAGANNWASYSLVANSIFVPSSVGTTLIANNAITTGKIVAKAITTNLIAANAVNADKIDAGSISAALIQSGTFRTADKGARVEITSVGINAYDGNGNITVQIDAATGNVTIYGIYSSGMTGDRVLISPKFTQTSIVKGDTTTGSGIEFPLANKYQQAPYIATESHNGTEGDVSALVFNGGQRTQGADGAQYGYGAYGRIGMRKDGKDKNEASHVYFMASADYNHTNDKTPTSRQWNSVLDLSVPYGQDSYAQLSSYGANGVESFVNVNASKQAADLVSLDANGTVGVEANVGKGYLYLGGYLGGWTGNRSTFMTNHWKSWFGGTGNGRYANVTYNFTAPKYGGYTWMACADTTTDQSYIHTGYQTASSVQVMGWGNYGTDVYATIFAWYHA